MDEADRFFGRFIDDMLSLTNGTEAEAVEFVNWLNTLWPGIKFIYEWSNKEITFLYVRLVVGEGGVLETDRHINPTNPQLYLHYTSNHPKSVFKAIVYGQALNVKLICSKEEFVVKHLKNLKKKFLERG